jgi:hypothetical protein
LWSTAPPKGRREPGEVVHSLHFSIPQETSSLRYLSRITRECFERLLRTKGMTRTFYDFPSGSFLVKLSLCEHGILSLSFADDDLDHGRGSQSVIVIRSYTISPFLRSDTTVLQKFTWPPTTTKTPELPAGNNVFALASSSILRTLRHSTLFEQF